MRKLVISILIILLTWYVISYIISPPEYLFPSIANVVKTFANSPQEYLTNSLYTITEILIGFIIANSLGLFLAIISVYNNLMENFFTMLSIIIKSIPIIAIAPLLVLWFGHGMGSKIAAVSISCFCPILINALSSAKIKKNEYKNLSHIYNISKFQEVKYIILPGIVPSLVTSFKISSSLAIVGALVSEFISANKGLGYLIISNYHSMNVAGVFVCIIISSIIGVSIFSICNHLAERVKL